MWWYLLQGTIWFAVVGSNIQWHWSDNYIVTNGLALFCAFAATALLGDLFRFLRWLGALIGKARRVRAEYDDDGDEMMTAGFSTSSTCRWETPHHADRSEDR